MGKFEDNQELVEYQNQYCSRCQHYLSSDEEYCAVFQIHQEYSGGRWSLKSQQEILDLLIPIQQNNNQQCSMFLAKEQHEVTDHEHFIEEQLRAQGKISPREAKALGLNLD